MPCEEEEGEGQKEEEAVVKVAVADAIDVAGPPCQRDDFGVQRERNAQGRHEDVTDLKGTIKTIT